ncbi:MAG: hypothetical protein ACOCZ5_00795 [bacterium]
MSQINRAYPPKYFSDTDINKLLLKGDKNLILLRKSKETLPIYNRLNEDIKLYLSKLPNSIAKKIVNDLYNRDKIYIVTSTSKTETGVISRAFMDNKLMGIGLISNELDIDLKTGESSDIDECIYAAYQGMIRASCVLFQDKIKKDHDLNKLLSTYFYLVVLRALGKTNIYSEKQKNFIYITCLFAYYRHYLDMNPNMIYSIIEKHYKDENLLKFYDEFKPSLKLIERYKDIKDLPKMFIDVKIMSDNPNTVNMQLIRNLKISGYYSLIGPLDLLVSMAILSKYPTNLYTRYALFEKMQDAIEKIFDKNYMSKVKYGESRLFKEIV